MPSIMGGISFLTGQEIVMVLMGEVYMIYMDPRDRLGELTVLLRIVFESLEEYLKKFHLNMRNSLLKIWFRLNNFTSCLRISLTLSITK